MPRSWSVRRPTSRRYIVLLKIGCALQRVAIGTHFVAALSIETNPTQCWEKYGERSYFRAAIAIRLIHLRFHPQFYCAPPLEFAYMILIESCPAFSKHNLKSCESSSVIPQLDRLLKVGACKEAGTANAICACQDDVMHACTRWANARRRGAQAEV